MMYVKNVLGQLNKLQDLTDDLTYAICSNTTCKKSHKVLICSNSHYSEYTMMCVLNEY